MWRHASQWSENDERRVIMFVLFKARLRYIRELWWSWFVSFRGATCNALLSVFRSENYMDSHSFNGFHILCCAVPVRARSSDWPLDWSVVSAFPLLLPPLLVHAGRPTMYTCLARPAAGGRWRAAPCAVFAAWSFQTETNIIEAYGLVSSANSWRHVLLIRTCFAHTSCFEVPDIVLLQY